MYAYKTEVKITQGKGRVEDAWQAPCYRIPFSWEREAFSSAERLISRREHLHENMPLSKGGEPVYVCKNLYGFSLHLAARKWGEDFLSSGGIGWRREMLCTFSYGKIEEFS